MEVEDSDQRNEGLDGGWGTEERVSLGIGGFTQSTAARGRKMAVPVEVAPEQSPGAAWARQLLPS